MLKKYLDSMKPVIDRQLGEFLPKNFNDAWLEANLGKLRYGYNEKSFSRLHEPMWELLKRGGKRWRPVFMILCCDMLGGGSKIIDFIPLIEIIHNGSLMIDDVEDGSTERRGKPCIHRMFGVDVAINTGNMMYFLPYLVIKKADLDNKTKLMIHEALAEEMIKLHFGQALDIHWHNNGDGVTEDLYMQMCAFKTGGLARLAARIGALLGTANKRKVNVMVEFAESVGVAFQIQDDILNITNKDWGKEFGDDISEGKITLMVLRVMEIGSGEDKQRLSEILKMKTKDPGLVKEAVDILKKYKTVDYAKNKAKSLIKTAWKQLDMRTKDSAAKDKMKLFADFLVKRKW